MKKNNTTDRNESIESQIIEGLSEFRDSLRTAKKLSPRFTSRTVELDLKPREYSADQIRLVREKLSASQAIFAELLGVSTATVQAWEQGTRKPEATACRLIDQIDSDPQRWISILEESIVDNTTQIA